MKYLFLFLFFLKPFYCMGDPGAGPSNLRYDISLASDNEKKLKFYVVNSDLPNTRLATNKLYFFGILGKLIKYGSRLNTSITTIYKTQQHKQAAQLKEYMDNNINYIKSLFFKSTETQKKKKEISGSRSLLYPDTLSYGNYILSIRKKIDVFERQTCNTLKISSVDHADHLYFLKITDIYNIVYNFKQVSQFLTFYFSRTSCFDFSQSPALMLSNNDKTHSTTNTVICKDIDLKEIKKIYKIGYLNAYPELHLRENANNAGSDALIQAVQRIAFESRDAATTLYKLIGFNMSIAINIFSHCVKNIGFMTHYTSDDVPINTLYFTYIYNRALAIAHYNYKHNLFNYMKKTMNEVFTTVDTEPVLVSFFKSYIPSKDRIALPNILQIYKFEITYRKNKFYENIYQNKTQPNINE